MLGDDNTKHFIWIDYLLSALVLLISFIVGMYFALSKNKPQTAEDYMLGRKSNKFLPIGLSIAATYISGYTLIAVPADIYRYGSNYLWTILGDLLCMTIMAFIFLPIFYDHQLVSVFSYLELRFDSKVRRFASILSTISTLIYTSVVFHFPASVCSQMTGLDSYIITTVIFIICVVYTSLGGFKAVIWTDVFQFLVIVGSSLAVVVIGVHSAGGFKAVMEPAIHGERLDLFDFKIDFSSRNTFWAAFIGNTFFMLSIFGVNPAIVQKCMALGTFSDVKKCIIVHVICGIAIKIIVVLLGNVVYARYSGCDPFEIGKIKNLEELIPYFVMDVTQDYHFGLPGFFYAGIICAALSSLSSSFNATANVIYKDFIILFLPENTSHQRRTTIIKLTVVILGILSVLLELIVKRVDGVFPFTTAMTSLCEAPLLGLFTLGMLFPRANSKGALIGGVSAVILTGWLVFANITYASRGLLRNEKKPVSIAQCNLKVNRTLTSYTSEEEVFILYRISFWYYALVGTIISVVVGVVVSCLTKREGTINPTLVHPIVRRFLHTDKYTHVSYNVQDVVVNERI